MTALWVIVLCGALSVVYAIWATSSVLGADAGNARMQEIAAAVREGAQAYLRRQYTTIGIVGIVIFALVSLLGPDRYDRVTVQDLVERPAPAIVVPTTPATPTTVQPTEMEPTTPESTPRP